MSEQNENLDSELTSYSLDDEDQLQPEDTLIEDGVDDVLDRGYSPPDSARGSMAHGVTEEEARHEETIEERIRQEVPDPATAYGAPDDESGLDRERVGGDDPDAIDADDDWGFGGYLGAAYTEQTSRYGLAGHSHEYEGCHPHGDHLHCGGGHGHGHDGHDHGDDDHEQTDSFDRGHVAAQDAVVDEHLLEDRRLHQEALVLLLGAEPHHPLDAGAVVPGAVEHHDLTAGGQVLDVARRRKGISLAVRGFSYPLYFGGVPKSKKVVGAINAALHPSPYF